MESENEYAKNWLKSNKDYHFNFDEFRGGYKVSTGSMIFDEIIGGGLGSGLIRFCGDNESGKTSEALEIQTNFLKTVENSKAVYVKAEGRFSTEMSEKTGVKYVYDADEWDYGTCLVLESNIYEKVFSFLRGLILNKKSKTRFNIIIDSMNGLLKLDDVDKKEEDAMKVAGGAVLASDFLRRTNLGLGKRGHQCIILSQRRKDIKINQYEKTDRNKLGDSSGGSALSHYPDWTFEFLRSNDSDKITPNSSEKPGPTNKPIGSIAKVKILKSTNDTTSISFSYPVKLKVKGRSSVWKEREIIDFLLAWEHLEKKGSWINTDEKLTKFLGEEIKVQGINSLYSLLEGNPDLTLKLEHFCRENILNQ